MAGRAADSDENKKGKRKGGGGFGLQLFTAFLLTALVILASGYLAYLQYSDQVISAKRLQRDMQTERFAERLAGQLQGVGQIVERAATNPAAAEALLSDDDSFLRSTELQLQQLLPTVTRVRYLRPEDQRPDPDEVPALGYACLELARIAEKGAEQPPIEVHLFGKDDQHIDIVRPIKSDSTIIASLMVTLDIDQLTDWFVPAAGDEGYWELRQMAGGESATTLVTAGDGGLKRGEPSHTARVEGTSWELAYWGDESIGMAEARQVAFLATFALAAAVVAGIFILLALWLKFTLKGDLRRLESFHAEVARGKRHHSMPMRLAAVRRTAGVLEEQLHLHAKSPAPAASQGGGHEPMPDVMFSGQEGISVEDLDEAEYDKGAQK